MPELVVKQEDVGKRLDQWLTTLCAELSRSRWQQLIKEGHVHVNGQARKPNYTIKHGEVVSYEIPPPLKTELVAENIPVEILYEDADILVLNKPAGLVVHPAPGHASGTLVNALLHRCKDLQGIGGELRPGIVHRLDRDTSGVLVVAKNEWAMQHLSDQFKNRIVKKEYIALVWGQPRPSKGTIKTLIGRSAHNRKKMSAKVQQGREAITHYEVIEQLGLASLLRVRIETGRTHQIRVHLSHIGHPVVGDTVYGRAHAQKISQLLHLKKEQPSPSPNHGGRLAAAAAEAGSPPKVKELLGVQLLPLLPRSGSGGGEGRGEGSEQMQNLGLSRPPTRQMLHAARLQFLHPRTNKPMDFSSPMPDDMKAFIRIF